MSPLDAPLAALYARAAVGIKLGLAPMRAALDRAQGPDHRFAIAHIAGTNGKGSVCAMLTSALRANGRRVGLYTSPHLCRFAERIAIDGAPIDDQLLAEVLEQALALAPTASFFEVATLAALLAFAREGVEVAVLEVGLGGRYDATNAVANKRVTAITSIGLDHQRYLGPDLPSIAREKAGILRAGVPCVLGALPAAARTAIAAVAAPLGAPLLDAAPLPIELQLAGAHQRGNAGVALALAEQLGVPHAQAIAAIGAARWPGRCELLDTPSGRWLLDGAHNLDGVSALCAAIAERPPAALVFGAMADKPALEMLAPLAAKIPRRIYVAPEGRTAFEPQALAAAYPGALAADVPQALALARAAAGADTALIAGSLYLVGSARAELLGLPSDPPIAM